MAEMIRKQIYIPKRLETSLKRLAKKRRISEAEIIREAIDQHVSDAQINFISEVKAQRSVTSWAVTNVGNLLKGGKPTLVEGEQMFWRVPVMMFIENKEVELANVDVDAQNGSLKVSQALIEEIWSKARAIKSASSEAN
jgi:predicted DNA-binding protein